MADNNFDDVESILDEEMSGEDKNFNDSELQDIMAEIEDLEKEFSDEIPAEMTLQEKIDAELATELADEEVVASSPMVEPVAEVLAFEKATPVAPVAAPVMAAPKTTIAPTSQVAFSAQGSMALNLDFQVGGESAKLTIDPVKGLTVTVSGVELCISEDSGCTVSMENGMKFTIPLSSQNNSHKKKAA